MKNSEMIVVKSSVQLDEESLNTLHKCLAKQKKEGVMVIPYYCEVVAVTSCNADEASIGFTTNVVSNVETEEETIEEAEEKLEQPREHKSHSELEREIRCGSCVHRALCEEFGYWGFSNTCGHFREPGY